MVCYVLRSKPKPLLVESISPIHPSLVGEELIPKFAKCIQVAIQKMNNIIVISVTLYVFIKKLLRFISI